MITKSSKETISAKELVKAQIAQQTLSEIVSNLLRLKKELQGTHYLLEMASVDVYNACVELTVASDKLAMLPEEAE